MEDVPLDGDPLRNLARAYLETSSYSPVQHDLRKPKEQMLLQRIESSRAEAVIIMGTQGRTGLKHVLMGSVAEKVVRLAPCPVLVTRGTANTSEA